MIASANTIEAVRSVLSRTLQLGARAGSLEPDTVLLGNLPELDSMAIVHVLTALEDKFGIAIADDEVSADTFSTFGGLASFVEYKLRS